MLDGAIKKYEAFHESAEKLILSSIGVKNLKAENAELKAKLCLN